VTQAVRAHVVFTNSDESHDQLHDFTTSHLSPFGASGH